jgi:hypothetical protein
MNFAREAHLFADELLYACTGLHKRFRIDLTLEFLLNIALNHAVLP